MKKGAVTFPEALRPVRVPREVTLVWAVASCAAATTPNARFEAFRFETVFPPPMKKGAVTFPDALRPVRVPREVTLVWAVANCAAATTPKARFEAFRFETVFPPPMKKGAVTLPDALRPVRVPREVTLVWAVASCAEATTPKARFEAFKLLRVFPDPTKLTAERAWRFEICQALMVPTLMVAAAMKGIEKVSKKKVVLVALAVMEPGTASWVVLEVVVTLRELRFEIERTLRVVKTGDVGNWELGMVPKAMFEAFREERAAPLAVTFETTTEAGRSALTRVRKRGGPVPPAAVPAKT